MIEIKKRDISIKCKKLRKIGEVTGTFKTIEGEIIPIKLSGNKIDQYMLTHKKGDEIDLLFEGNCIKAKIFYIERNLLIHNVDNIDLVQV